MVQFAHIADTHLGYRQFNNDEREHDFYESFNEAIDIIIKEHVDFVIHAGDLFENNRPYPRALKVAQEAIKRLNEANIKVFAIPGNHDLVFRKGSMPPQTLFNIFDNFVLLGGKDKVAKFNDIFIGGISYTPRFYVNALKNDLKELSVKAKEYKKRILIIHQGIDRLLPFPGAYELRLEELPEDFHYYALGHIHVRHVENFGLGKLAYPGSIDVWRFDEVEDYKKNKKGFYIVDFSDSEVDVQKVDLSSTRPFETFSIDVQEVDKKLSEIYSLLENICNNAHKKPVVRITITGKSSKEFAYYNAVIANKLRTVTHITRIDFKLEKEELILQSYRSDRIDFYKLFKEHFKDDETAQFAYDLFRRLSQDNIEGAKKFAEYYFENRWKK
ncbi:MAG: metallophosphoesterase [Candidatus Asgardarchaeia archaeon]